MAHRTYKSFIAVAGLLSLGFIANAGEMDSIPTTTTNTTTTVSTLNTEVQALPWKQEITGQRNPLEYETIREADVFWTKTVWRVIDTREKMNLPFKWPKKPFMTMLMDAATKGEIAVYDGLDDEFKNPIEPKDIGAMAGAGTDTIDVIDPVTGIATRTAITKEVNFDNVQQFRIKEVWFFNKQTSVMNVRIMGLSPILDSYDEYGNFRGVLPLFWAYFPDLRDVFVKAEAFNPFPNGIKLTWDDIFSMRLFSSYVYKEDNVRDYKIANYTTGIDALYESERIKDVIFNFEHDLWSY